MNRALRAALWTSLRLAFGLAKGAPIADVLTMLEVRHWSGRSTTDCRAYAIEILWTAKHQFDASKNQRNPAPKETKYAVA